MRRGNTLGLREEVMEALGPDKNKLESEVESVEGLMGLYDVWINIRAWRALGLSKADVIKMAEDQLKVLSTLEKELTEEFNWKDIISRERKAITLVHEEILND